jgi:hypothetical protein
MKWKLLWKTWVWKCVALKKKVMEWSMDNHRKDTKCAKFGYSSLEVHASQSWSHTHISGYCQKHLWLIFICDLLGLQNIDCNKDKVKLNTLPKWFIWIGNTNKPMKTYASVILKHEEYPKTIKENKDK